MTLTPVGFRTIQEVLAFERPADLNLLGDMHLQRGRMMLIAGAPGTGKSRALCGLALAGALGPAEGEGAGTGAEWFGLPVHTRFRTLILQCENSAERLRGEWQDMTSRHVGAELDAWVRISLPPSEGFRLGGTAFLEDFRRQVAAFRPHVIGLDPWLQLAGGPSTADTQRALALIASALPEGPEGPALVIVAHTRRPRPQERRTGRDLLHLVSGTPLLTAAARSVFVLQHASSDTEENRVILTCCKNNDGSLGRRSAWLRRNGLFAPLPAPFDWEAFDGPERRTNDWSRKVHLAHIQALFAGSPASGLTLAEAATRLMALASVSRTTAYRSLALQGDFDATLTHEAGKIRIRSRKD